MFKSIVVFGLLAALLYIVGRRIWEGRNLYGRPARREATGNIMLLNIGLLVIAVVALAF